MIITLTLTDAEIKALEQFDSSIMFAYPEMQSILRKVYESAEQEKKFIQNSCNTSSPLDLYPNLYVLTKYQLNNN